MQDATTTDLPAQILETWNIHNRVLLFLLDGIAPEALEDAVPARSRSVADHLAHAHHVRLMWLKASAPDLLAGLEKIEKGANADPATLRTALETSAAAISALLERGLANGGKIKGFKPHAVAFLGYLIAHEHYHAGKADFILRQSGHPVDDKTHYGLWEWGVR